MPKKASKAKGKKTFTINTVRAKLDSTVPFTSLNDKHCERPPLVMIVAKSVPMGSPDCEITRTFIGRIVELPPLKATGAARKPGK